MSIHVKRSLLGTLALQAHFLEWRLMHFAKELFILRLQSYISLLSPFIVLYSYFKFGRP